ncbi:hypothetical protein OU426_07910 [Frigidibacter sp. RF13]|uniref:hypothetical protein n=1 Tax=Frigidibacter sp. RF13 TaxID=2997340 RepID=UPI002270E1EC|nr:hypothetical protein [Frigidibacter sp. RF13]MCY1126773.1 hypothetical protein [Frigidibacter sp. RF13]
MMKTAARVVLALFAGLWMPAVTLAETVTVRSGEHGDFTRLVVDLGGDRQWQFGRTEDGYLLQVEDPTLQFDIACVFERVPRTRLTRLSAAAGELRLTLATSTFALLAKEGGGRLIIDMRHGTAPKGSPYENAIATAIAADDVGKKSAGPLPHPVSTPPAAAPGLAATLSYRPETNSAASLPIYWRNVLEPGAGQEEKAGAAPETPQDPEIEVATNGADLETGPEDAAASPLPGDGDDPGSPATDLPPDLPLDLPTPGFGMLSLPVPSPEVLALEEDLREQVARAASQGLAEASVDKIADPHKSTEKTGHQEAPAKKDMPAEPPTADDHIAFHAETSMDRDARDNPRAVSVTEDGLACPDEELIDLRHWGDDRAAPLQLAEARGGLTGEFDRPDEAAVLRLARLYLYFGMGAEARSVMTGFGLQAEGAPLLVDMSYMVDDRSPPPPGAFAPYAQCETSAALWAFLSTPDAAPPPVANLPALIRTFSGLPAPLRIALGPRLSNRLIAAGALDAAKTVRNAVARKADDHIRPLRMIEAEIALGEGEADAHEKLTDLAEGSDDFSAKALILSVEGRLQKGEAVPASEVDDLAALAFERRNGDDADRLAALEIKARAASGDLPHAFERFADWSRDAPAETARKTALTLFAALGADPDDASFLGEYFARKPFLPADADADVRLRLAERLGGLGLYEEAHLLLPATLHTGDEARLVLARAAAQAFRYEEVIAMTGGLDQSEARALRAEALDALGDHAAAADLYAALGESAAAAGAAWRGGDLARALTDGSFGEMAAILGADPSAPQENESAPGLTEAGATLAGSKSLLMESSELRTALTALLAAQGSAGAP